ncbi:MAG TPA: GTP-binding protein, partial [Saprospiraceae bacterium]|nr:GTP-binding protein [Saprospiraceae bacterium]
ICGCILLFYILYLFQLYNYTNNELFIKLLNGERAILSQIVTLAESRLPEDQQRINELLALLPPAARSGACRIGITGSPGVGKSSLIDRLGLEFIARGHRPAVLTIDPSSAITGGSILGDKARMPELSKAKEAFIRPSPSLSELGGVNPYTRRSMRLLEAASYDRVIIETVGIGQSETDISDLADMVVYLVQPASGDDLQAIKKGILEYADILVVTKWDGPLEARAEECFRDLSLVMHSGSLAMAEDAVSLVRASVYKPETIALLADHIENKFNVLVNENKLFPARLARESHYFRNHWPQELKALLQSKPEFGIELESLANAVQNGSLSIEKAFQKLIQFIFARC